MSFHVVSWVLEHSPAQLVNRLVLVVLADHADKEGGSSHPSVATIAHEARCSERSVRYALDALQGAGAIEQTGVGPRGVRCWQVVMTDQAKAAKFAPRPTGSTPADIAVVGGAIHDSAGVQSTTAIPESFAPEPVNGQEGTGPIERSIPPTPASGGDPVFPAPPARPSSRRRRAVDHYNDERAAHRRRAAAFAAEHFPDEHPDAVLNTAAMLAFRRIEPTVSRIHATLAEARAELEAQSR